jgi:uncharacterized protein (TIGR02147 family)
MLLESHTVQEFLGRELDRRVKVNPRYSQRGFARSLGLSPGELSEVLRGKRKLGLKGALKISRSMGLNPAETKHLLNLAQIEKSKEWNIETRLTSEPAPLTTNTVNDDVYHLVSEWYYFPILSLFETKDFRWNSIWIAKRLGITRTQAKVAMERLTRLNLVKKEYGRFVCSNDYVLSTEGVPSTAVRQSHRQLLNKALHALDFHPVNERDIRGMGFACDTRDIEAIRAEINEFMDRIFSKYRKTRNATDVYHMEVALFRLTEDELKTGAEK